MAELDVNPAPYQPPDDMAWTLWQRPKGGAWEKLLTHSERFVTKARVYLARHQPHLEFRVYPPGRGPAVRE